MKIKNVFMNVVIGVLCLVLVAAVFFTIYEVKEYHTNYRPDENSFLYSVGQQDYGALVEMMYRNEAADVKTNAIYEECYAVARYYEAATYYKAYKLAGNQELADKKHKIMEEQILLMGDLSYAAGDIDMMLGIH